MSITRTFLDWNQPALPQVADFLISKYLSLETVDLSGVVIVVPGRRAGRRLREILVEKAVEQSLRLIPPLDCTVGTLPELLYKSKLPFASELVQKLAWGHALRELPAESLQQIVPLVPDVKDLARWKELGDVFWRQHRELAADGIDFEAVADLGAQLNEFDEGDRWRVMRQVQQLYLDTLDDLKLWDRQTARLFAIENNECTIDKEIVLVGTADMNMAMRSMIDQVADRVTALVHAPERLADHFDKHGCLIPEQWEHFDLELSRKNIRVVDSPDDQANEVVRCLADLDGKYRVDELCVGMTDHALVPLVQRRLKECHIASRWVVGDTLNETGPCRFLSAIANWLANRQTADFAALVRHPDVENWLSTQEVQPLWLFELDKYLEEHLQPKLGFWLGPEAKCAGLKQVYTAIEELVTDLNEPARFLDQWAAGIQNVLLTVYGQTSVRPQVRDDEVTLEACREICKVLAALGQIPAQLVSKVTAVEALRFVLEQLQDQMIPSSPDDEAIELLGWLELPLDDAPAVVVTSFNEGHVPTSVNSDLFLPNRLRKLLGVVDNLRRYARDAYALSVLLASRESVQLVVGRRTVQGEPLTPSRLLFATKVEEIPERVLEFYEASASNDATGRQLPNVWHTDQERSLFEIPYPQPLAEPLTSLSVTAFRTYLACPYRFYLRHVLKLQTVEPSAVELNALGFGNLIHEVLKKFGESDCRESKNVKEIETFLSAELDDRVRRWYGGERMAAVNVQIEQLRRRLHAFADWQAKWASEGWVIRHTEVAANDHNVSITADAGSIQLTGRIDRIDHNPQTGEWMIFDYKSSATAKSPKQTHEKSKEWIDLQLPLYRTIGRKLGTGDSPGLGYINLPKDISKVGGIKATWTEEVLETADATARDVVQSILTEQFWPPKDVPEKTFEEFAGICQDKAFEKIMPAAVGAGQ